MAKPILVANWKNHPGSLTEAQSLLKKLSSKRLLYKKLALFIAPPLPYLESVSVRAESFAKLAAQDLSSVQILKSLGVKLAIIGHSEHRALGETNEQVAEKVRAALRSGITPLLCIGETVRDTDGEHFEFIRDELKASLTGINRKAASKLAVAYEPAWAIGKHAKDALPPEELAQSVIFLRKVLADLYGRNVAESIPILYGGSVEGTNAGRLMEESSIRGFLVGHASLDARIFERIARSLLEK